MTGIVKLYRGNLRLCRARYHSKMHREAIINSWDCMGKEGLSIVILPHLPQLNVGAIMKRYEQKLLLTEFK